MKIFRLFSAILWAIPFYYLWNYLAPIYAPQLPAQYLDVPYWHIAGIFALLTIIKIILSPRGHHHYHRRDWKGGHYFGKYAKFCNRGYWKERYYHHS